MAAALLNHRAQGAVRVRSAGSEPADSLNPAVVEAMSEIGLDISEEFPKPITDELVSAADVVITMGAAMPVRSTRESDTWTGSSTTRQAGRSPRSGGFATRSTAACRYS